MPTLYFIKCNWSCLTKPLFKIFALPCGVLTMAFFNRAALIDEESDTSILC